MGGLTDVVLFHSSMGDGCDPRSRCHPVRSCRYYQGLPRLASLSILHRYLGFDFCKLFDRLRTISMADGDLTSDRFHAWPGQQHSSVKRYVLFRCDSACDAYLARF